MAYTDDGPGSEIQVSETQETAFCPSSEVSESQWTTLSASSAQYKLAATLAAEKWSGDWAIWVTKDEESEKEVYGGDAAPYVHGRRDYGSEKDIVFGGPLGSSLSLSL